MSQRAREKPIVRNAQQVRAILNGATQFRTIVPERVLLKCMPPQHESFLIDVVNMSPYRVGDVLWVKTAAWYDPAPIAAMKGVLRCFYDDGTVVFSDGRKVGEPTAPVTVARLKAAGLKRRSSIHMPRWASRIRLLVTGVGIGRVQSISEADAIAEGMRAFTKDGKLMKYWACDPSEASTPAALRMTWQEMPRNPVDAFAQSWDSIRGSGAWQHNPWVWVNTFERMSLNAATAVGREATA